MASRRLRSASAASVLAVLLSLVGGFLTPAAQAAQVSASDTLRSGLGLGWGRNDHGQSAPAVTTNPQLGARQLPAGAGGLLTDAVSIGAGNGFALWVDHAGMVWAIGQNDLGQLGTGSTSTDKRTPVKSWGFGSGSDPKAVKVSAYGTEGIALDANGAVWHWGKYLCSATSYTTNASPSKLAFPSGTTRIVDVAAGNGFALAMDDGGRVYAWGVNDHGQLGQGTTTGSASPLRISSIAPFTSGQQYYLDAGRDFGLLAISSPTGTTLQTWGRGDSYQLGNGSTADKKVPTAALTIPAPAKVLALSGGGTHGLLLTNDGATRTWGNNGLTTNPTPVVLTDAALTGSHHPYTVAAGDNASFTASTDGTVAAWGADTNGQLGRTVTGNLTVPTIITVPFTSLSTGGNVPALLTSRNNATYVVADGQVQRYADPNPYDLGAFSTTPASGQTPTSHLFTLKNVATKALSVTSVIVDGANPGDFPLTGNTCTGTIAIDASCSFTVTFVPTAAGNRQAGVIVRVSNSLGGVPMQTFVNVIGRGYTPVAGLANLSLDLAPGSPTTVAGPGNSIPLANIPPSLIPSTLPVTPAAQLGKVPLAGTQLGKVQLGKVQLGKVQLGKVQLGKVQLGKVPLSGIQLGKVQLGKVQLGKVQLGKVPLLRQGGWAELLSAYPKLRDLPISSLTLQDLLDPAKNAPDPAITTALPLERVTLSDIAVANSELAQVSVLSLLAGGLRLDQFGGIDWCADLPKVTNGGSCTDGNGLGRILLGLDLQGVPIENLRVGSTTVGQLTGATALDDALFPQILLNSVTLPGTHVGAIALSSIPTLSSVLDCTKASCTNLAGRTLGDADIAAALQPTASFRDLGSALNPITLGQLVEPFMDRGSFDWESLPLASIPLAAYPNRVTLKADADINCAKATGTTIAVKLPAGFQYVPATTTLAKTRGTGNVSLGDPVLDPTRGLVISIPDSSFTSTGAIACTDDTGHLSVTLGVLSGTTAGSYRATGDARTTSIAPVTTTQTTPLAVTGLQMPPDDTPDGPLASSDQLIIGSIATPGQVKYVPIEVPAGKVLEATIASQTADFDGALFYPKGALIDPALSVSTPSTQVPFGEANAIEPDDLHSLTTTYGGALQDIPLLTDRPIAAVAATRGTDVEQLTAVTRAGQDTRHVLSISGYNGATGSFTVRLRVTDGPALADCVTTPVTPGALPTTPFYGSTGYAAGDTTVVLVNASRLSGRFGQTAATQALDALKAYVGKVKGQVLQVDSDASVRAAYAAWDASPCDPLTADGVVRAINAFVYANAPSTITDVVLAGGDEMVPHARLEDHTRDGNEREEAADLAINGGNALASSFAAGYYFSDDPYGTRTPQAVLGQVIYLPQAVVARVGESAADIAAQANAFVTNDGVADPQSASTRTAVVTDYDYLTSGSNLVATSLGGDYAVDHSLTGTAATWTKTQLDAAWLNKVSVPSVAVLNMHYDQYRGLPAYGNATGDQSQLYTAAQVASGPSLDRRVVFTVGCHSALDVPDSLAVGDARVKDFAQAYAGKATAAMIGNLGFGYADTTTVAYSSQLQAYFAQGLASKYDLGTALLEAKRLYVDRLSGLSGYDLKSAQQVILWGLPQYRLTSAPAATPAAPPVTIGAPDPSTGLTSQVITVGTSAKPLSISSVNDGTSTHLTAAATVGPDTTPHTVAVPGKPVLPAQFVDVPQVAGKVVRSVVPISLTSDPLTSVTATFAKPSVDHGQPAEPLSNGAFPASLGHVGTSIGTVSSNTLVVTPAQFIADGTAPGAGAVRTFPQSSWLATYGLPGDTKLATISRVAATRIPSSGAQPATTSYSIDVIPASGRTTKDVYVLALPSSGSGQWVRTNLIQDGTTNHWVGGSAGLNGQFIVISHDNVGDASTSDQKGLGWVPFDLAAPIDPAFPVQLQLSPGAPASRWFTVSPTVTILDNTGAPAPTAYKISIDGGAPVPSGTVVPGNGVHTVSLVAPDGSLVPGALTVLVDAVVPQVRIEDAAGPRIELNQDEPFTSVASFGPSGPSSVSDTGRALGSGRGFNASTVGAQSLDVTATSVAGLIGTASRPYRVVYGSASSGFLSPVASAPGLNLTVRTLVYGFSHHLVDHNLVDVTSGAGTGNAVAFTDITCPNTQYKVQLPKLTGATAQPVHQGAGVWNWDIAMPNPGNVLVCKHLTVTANDGYTTFGADVQIAP